MMDIMENRKLRYISLFSGIEAVSVALDGGPWEPVAFCEIDRFPSEVLAYHWPDVPNLGDITKADWTPYVDKVDVVFGGSPCFVGGSLVMTVDGPKPIEDIRVGDVVLTHRNRWRKVTAVGHKTADTIIVKGQGSTGIECTPNHPFWACTKEWSWDNDRRSDVPHLTDPKWTCAENLKGMMWLNAGEAESLPIVEPDNSLGVNDVQLSTELFYFVGRWLGDGWANRHHRKNRKNSDMKRVYVCDSKDKADELRARLDATGMHFCMSENATNTVRFTCSSSVLYEWLTTNFGVHAIGKRIPGWCLGMKREWRQAMFDGYRDSDGCVTNNGWHFTTISHGLFLGMKMLAASLGYATSVTSVVNKRPCAIIDGRMVHENPQWSFTVYNRSRSAVVCNQGFWGLVRKVLPGRSDVTVYNMTVDEDNSYTVDGIAVHNCQSFSTAGKREGLKGESGLMFEYIRCVREVRPRWFVWENVPGALSSEHGGAFRQLLSEMDALGYGLAWRVLDAQFFGVAQRRERLFLVGSLGTMRSSEVLFEREGVPWDYSSSRDKRKALAGESSRRSGESDSGPGGGDGGTGDGGCLTPDENQSRRVYSSDGVFPTLSARSNSGQNQQSIYLCETANTGSNGFGIKRDDVMNTLDTSVSTAVAFAQNQRNEVRVMDVPGALSAQSGSKQQSYVALDFHQQDGRAKVSDTPDVSMTITAHAGTGGNNVPMVMSDSVQTPSGSDDVQGRKPDERRRHGGDESDADGVHVGAGQRAVRMAQADVMAFGWQNSSGCGLSIGDTSPTLQTEKVPAVWPA